MSCSIRSWKELDICYEREYFTNTSTSITFTSFLSPSPSSAFLYFFSIHFSPQSNTSVPNATTNMLHHFWCVKLSDVNFLLLYFFFYISLTNEIQLPSPACLPIPPPKKKTEKYFVFIVLSLHHSSCLLPSVPYLPKHRWLSSFLVNLYYLTLKTFLVPIAKLSFNILFLSFKKKEK